MKTILILFVSVLILFHKQTSGNPINPPPIISELYFDDNDEWHLELYFGMGNSGFSSQDLYLATSCDTVQFKSGWLLYPDIIIVINKDSLVSPLSINRNGDNLQILIKILNDFIPVDIDDFIFGNYPFSNVSAPLSGQAVKRAEYCPYGPPFCYYIIVKDNEPTLGFAQFSSVASSEVNGYVYDQYNNPFPNAKIQGTYIKPYLSFYTDSNGYFQVQNLLSCRQNVYAIALFCDAEGFEYIAEPDSAVSVQIQFNSCSVGDNEYEIPEKYEMNIFPNPGKQNFTFEISSPFFSEHKCLLKIYSISGELIIILPVFIEQHKSIVLWNGTGKYSDINSGIYVCSLEVNGRNVHTGKLIVEK